MIDKYLTTSGRAPHRLGHDPAEEVFRLAVGFMVGSIRVRAALIKSSKRTAAAKQAAEKVDEDKKNVPQWLKP